MIDMQTFLVTVMITSVFTSLTTEAVKKIMSDHDITYPVNTLAGIIALILALAIGVGYMLMNGLAFNLQAGVYLVALIFVSWLCSMVGYDKVIQAIEQFKTKKED